MELVELRRITKQRFNKTDVDLVEMLIVWCETETAAYQQRMLAGSGINAAQFGRILADMRSASVRIPQNLLTKAVCGKTGYSFRDTDMIRHLLLDESSALTNRLKNEGVDVGAVLSNIESAKTASNWAGKEAFGRQFFSHPAGTNMTQKALSGAYGHLVGREDDLDRIEDVLLRKNKANVILTGLSGVGKTALVELMARESALHDTSRLYTYQFFEVHVDTLLSGTALRGELERKLGDFVSQAEKARPVVLFIDEIHRINLSQDGRGTGSQVAEMLKPYLDRDEIKLIGATTTEEYQRCIAKDSALARRFTQIGIEEPKGDALFRMVRKYANALEQHHSIRVDDAVISAVVALTDQYMKCKAQPDKANEVLDTACVSASRKGHSAVAQEDVVRAVTAATKIPAYILLKQTGTVNALASKLKAAVIGQDAAIETVTGTLAVKMAGLKNADAPLAVFMFAGDSGVGKTELAKRLALEVMGDQRRLTVIDMAEYSSAYTASKLIGSPPGYVDSEKEGVIPAALAKNAYQVIVFDEIEKAAPEIHRLLLGLMDTGRITSGTGRVYDATNAILVMTTNAVTSGSIRKSVIGFERQNDDGGRMMIRLREFFPAEFLGRIDDIVMFNALRDEDYETIIGMHIDTLFIELTGRGIHVSCDKEQLVRHVMRRFNYREIGVRGVLQAIRNNVLKPVVIQTGQTNENACIDFTKLMHE